MEMGDVHHVEMGDVHQIIVSLFTCESYAAVCGRLEVVKCLCVFGNFQERDGVDNLAGDPIPLQGFGLDV